MTSTGRARTRSMSSLDDSSKRAKVVYSTADDDEVASAAAAKKEKKALKKAEKAAKAEEEKVVEEEAVEEDEEVRRKRKEEKKLRKKTEKEALEPVEEAEELKRPKKKQELLPVIATGPAVSIEDITTFEAAKQLFPRSTWGMFEAVTKTFKTPTPIQAKTWGASLSGKDVIGIAATGSGKTLAFMLPAVAVLMSRERTKAGTQNKNVAKPRVLVLAPTRELCMQSYEVAVTACSHAKGIKPAMVYGGQSRSTQQKSLREAPDVLVATPGRLMDFMESEDLALDECEFIVLDEADRMLDMGFERDVRKIISQATLKGKQTLMFSATWPESIRTIAAEFLDPKAVRVTLSGDKLKANASIEQSVEVMDQTNKEKRLLEILNDNKKARIIVFALYKKEAERLQQTLVRKGFKAAGVHGDKSQPEREAAVSSFVSGQSLILVATDVAARGLDIKGVELVINYTFPLTIEDYVHRIGRTGRAGATGKAITFFTEYDKARAGELQNVLREAGVAVPEGLKKFGGTVKKKEHALYGAHFKRDSDLVDKAPTKVSFDSDDE